MSCWGYCSCSHASSAALTSCTKGQDNMDFMYNYIDFMYKKSGSHVLYVVLHVSAAWTSCTKGQDYMDFMYKRSGLHGLHVQKVRVAWTSCSKGQDYVKKKVRVAWISFTTSKGCIDIIYNSSGLH